MTTVNAEATDSLESQYAVDLDRPVALEALTYLDEGDDVTVGRQDIDSYCMLPADGAALLRRLETGETPRAAQGWYEVTYGEPVDMAEFLETMHELGFLATGARQVTKPPGLQTLGRVLFSRVAMLSYAATVGAAVVVAIDDHQLIPSYRNLFFSQYLTSLLIVLFFGQFPFLLLHEAFHLLAGRRLGLRSRLTVGRRMYFAVFLTTMDGLVSVPRRKRYLPILAGMLCDLLVVAVLTLIAAAVRTPSGAEPLAGRICLALAMSTVLRFVWQFYLHLQTDLYHLFVTLTGCVNLQATAHTVLMNRVNRALHRPAKVQDETAFHPVDRKVARWYSWLLGAGYAFSIGTLAFVGVPAVLRVLHIMWHRFSHGHLHGEALLDCVLFLTLNAAQFAAFAVVLVRDRRRRPKAVLQETS